MPGGYYGHQFVYPLSVTSAESIGIYIRNTGPDVAAALGIPPGLQVELSKLQLDTTDPDAVVLSAPIESQTVSISPAALAGATGGRIHLRLGCSAGVVDASYSLDGGVSYLPSFASTSSSFGAFFGAPGLFWAGAGAVSVSPAAVPLLNPPAALALGLALAASGIRSLRRRAPR